MKNILLYSINGIGLDKSHSNTNSKEYTSINIAVQNIKCFDTINFLYENMENRFENTFWKVVSDKRIILFNLNK